MKPEAAAAACMAQLIARAARGEGKTGEGKVSTEAIASILGLPGEPIFSEPGVGGVGTGISAISLQSDLHLPKTPNMLLRVEFPNPARACMHAMRRSRAVAENSFTAVQHLTKPLFLSKPAEPPLSSCLLCSNNAIGRLLQDGANLEMCGEIARSEGPGGFFLSRFGCDTRLKK